MTETEFIKQNTEKWKELESLLKQKTKDPDKLHDLFVKVSSDLSHARTFYPNRSVRLYLNHLTQSVLDTLGERRQKISFSDLAAFFQYTLPREVRRSWKSFATSFFVFIVAIGIGIISSAHNPQFARVIMGDDYIDITEENINSGDPMAIYKDEDKLGMTYRITVNNILVAFTAFVLGLLGTFGTIFVLLSNGIMLGTFQYFFYSKGLFVTSFLTIWIHGTIEISAIIIAGAAGIVLGKGVLFPKTYDRLQSIQISARRALTILLGTIPLFVLAGILESFVTRLTELPSSVKILIILSSLLFVLFLWVWLPRRSRKTFQREFSPEHFSPLVYQPWKYRNHTQNIVLTFTQLRNSMGKYLAKIYLPSLVIASFTIWLNLNLVNKDAYELMYALPNVLQYGDGNILTLIVFIGILTLSLLFFSWHIKKWQGIEVGWVNYIKSNAAASLAISILFISPFYFLGTAAGFIALIFLPPSFYINILNTENPVVGWKECYQKTIANYFIFFAPAFATLAFFSLISLIASSGFVQQILVEFITWHNIFELSSLTQAFVEHLTIISNILLTLPFAYYIFTNYYHSERSGKEAIDLNKRFEFFGQTKKLIEQS